jgi:L-threonylcarbamoyladenylate synthase
VTPGGRCEILSLVAGEEMHMAVRRASEVLRGGGVILYPTDTVYGLGCLAGNTDAVRRVYTVKGRPETRPSLVLVDSVAMAEGLAADIPALARKIMRLFWPGPVTLVLKASAGIPEPLTAGTGKIGIRLPADEFCRRLAGRCGSAVVSTSANPPGKETSPDFRSLLRLFGGAVDLAVDAGERSSPPSTVADVSDGSLTIVREGAVSGADLTRALSTRP